MVDVKCPKCATVMPYVPDFAGREIFCLGCGSNFTVPDLGEQPADTTATFKVVMFRPDDPLPPATDQTD